MARRDTPLRACKSKPQRLRVAREFKIPTPDRLARTVQQVAHAFPIHPADGAFSVQFLIVEQRIDRMIITTPDYTHADYICRTLEAGADVVVEKPLTIDADSVRRNDDVKRAYLHGAFAV